MIYNATNTKSIHKSINLLARQTTIEDKHAINAAIAVVFKLHESKDWMDLPNNSNAIQTTLKMKQLQ